MPFAVLSLYVVAGTPFIHIEDQILEKMLLGYAFIIACMLGKAVSHVMYEEFEKLAEKEEIVFPISYEAILQQFEENSRKQPGNGRATGLSRRKVGMHILKTIF